MRRTLVLIGVCLALAGCQTAEVKQQQEFRHIVGYSQGIFDLVPDKHYAKGGIEYLHQLSAQVDSGELTLEEAYFQYAAIMNDVSERIKEMEFGASPVMMVRLAIARAVWRMKILARQQEQP